jgi:diaminopimelate decarboxylase
MIKGILKNLEQAISVRNNSLFIYDYSIDAIVQEYGSPLYLYMPEIISLKLALLRKYLPDVTIYYSLKANPNPYIVKLMLQNGCGLDVASGGELFLARECGCKAKDIVFAGPGKSDDEIEQSIDTEIGSLNVESMEEIESIHALSLKKNRKVDIGIRINLSSDVVAGSMQMGGKPTQFGFDEDDLFTVIDFLTTCDTLRLKGIHVYTGTQITEYTELLKIYARTLLLAGKLSERLKTSLDFIDLGGGLGVPYFEHEKPLDIAALGEHAGKMIKEFKSKPYNASTRIILEPGRFLIAEAGLYITRVISCKPSRNMHFAVCDGGMNHHSAAAGNLGQIIKKNYPICNASNVFNDTETPRIYDICGPLCTPIDTIGRKIAFSGLKKGNAITIFNSGAYGYTASPLMFLGHPAPREIVIFKDRIQIIREAGNLNDLLRNTGMESGCK